MRSISMSAVVTLRMDRESLVILPALLLSPGWMVRTRMMPRMTALTVVVM